MTKIDVDVLRKQLEKLNLWASPVEAMVDACLAAQAEKDKPDAKCGECGHEYNYEADPQLCGCNPDIPHKRCPACRYCNDPGLSAERFRKAHAPKPSFGLYFAVSGPESQEQLDSEFREWVKARGWNIGHIETSGFVGFDPAVGKPSESVVQPPPSSVRRLLRDAELKGCRLWCDQLGGPCAGERCGSYKCRAIRKAILAAYPDVVDAPEKP